MTDLKPCNMPEEIWVSFPEHGLTATIDTGTPPNTERYVKYTRADSVCKSNATQLTCKHGSGVAGSCEFGCKPEPVTDGELREAVEHAQKSLEDLHPNNCPPRLQPWAINILITHALKGQSK